LDAVQTVIFLAAAVDAGADAELPLELLELQAARARQATARVAATYRFRDRTDPTDASR
jgi:hypothetical protein